MTLGKQRQLPSKVLDPKKTPTAPLWPQAKLVASRVVPRTRGPSGATARPGRAGA